uniref:Lipocalin n=1 Tax=Caenorhabditis tropicalis TaxID=1561998 RepID=A0A1I7V3V4_9PELO
MVPLQGPILKSILLLIFVILISVKAQTRKAPFDGIMRMKNTKNVTGSFLTAQEKNSHVHMFMVSRVPIHYEIVKCNKTLLSTRVNMTFQEVTFTNAWVNWIFNDNCSETDHLKFNVFANKYFNVTFGIEFLSGESAKLLDPDRIHFVHHVANESSIFNTSVAPLFFEANATEGKNLHLISDLTSRATVSFGKCGYELSKYY